MEVTLGPGVGVAVALGPGVGVAVGPVTVIFVSVAAVDGQVLPSDKSAVAQTAVVPPETAVTTVEYIEVVSEAGLTVAIAVLYEPKRIRVIADDPSPEVTLAVIVLVAATAILYERGEAVT